METGSAPDRFEDVDPATESFSSENGVDSPCGDRVQVTEVTVDRFR